MKLISMIRCSAVIALFVASPSTPFAGEDKEVKITMEKVPAPVQLAVKGYATLAEIKNIEESDAEGTKVIEFDIEKNGKESEVAFRLDGKLFSTEEKITLTECPAEVQKAITDLGKDGKIRKIEKSVKEGIVSYEVAIKKGGKKAKYQISPTGAVTEETKTGKE